MRAKPGGSPAAWQGPNKIKKSEHKFPALKLLLLTRSTRPPIFTPSALLQAHTWIGKCCLGLAVNFGLLRIVNFANGAFFTAAAFEAWLLNRYLGLGCWIALAFVPFAVGTDWRRFRTHPATQAVWALPDQRPASNVYCILGADRYVVAEGVMGLSHALVLAGSPIGSSLRGCRQSVAGCERNSSTGMPSSSRPVLSGTDRSGDANPQQALLQLVIACQLRGTQCLLDTSVDHHG